MDVGLAEVGYRQCRAGAIQTISLAGRVEQRLDLVGEDPFSAHPPAETAVAQPPAPQGVDPVEDLVSGVGEMLPKPILE